MAEELKLLIVDDSLIFRKAMEQALKGEPDVRIVGSVMNGVKAMEFINSSTILPDIVSLDVEMPGMNGLETLEAIQKSNEARGSDIGVIMVSAHTHSGAQITIKALELGAFDFIAKPSGESLVESMEMLRNSLMTKLRLFSVRRKRGAKARPPETPPPAKVAKAFVEKPPTVESVRAVVVGVSTGGPKALSTFLPALSEVVDLPIFIVQHMPPLFTATLAESLNAKCRHEVVEAADSADIRGNGIYIAPGGKHMVLRKNDNGFVCTALNEQPAENGCRPSVDVLFRSAAAVYNGNLVAVILTGMGTDGAKSVPLLKRAGAHCIVQDEATSVVWGMPGSAVATGQVDEILPLMDIPGAVKKEIFKRGWR